jgi:hypothetical protein
MRAEMTALSLAAITATGSAILGGVVAAIALSAAVRDIYLRTVGRRRDRYRRLRRLGTEAQLDFFAAVLGEPPAIRRTITKTDFLEYLGSGDPGYDPDRPEFQMREVSRDLTECFFIDRDYYVQTISDADETVLAYSVTSRARRFRPRLEVPPRPPLRSRWRTERRWRREGRKVLKVRLLSTRFADLDSPDPKKFNGVRFEAYTGARSYSYSEFHYMGAMGVYQDFILTASSATPVAGRHMPLADALREVGANHWPDFDRPDDPDWEDLPLLRKFRRETPITGFTVISVKLLLANYPTTYGPHGEGIRTLP